MAWLMPQRAVLAEEISVIEGRAAGHRLGNYRVCVTDDHGHGTAMAGIVVARDGLHGNAPGVSLLVAKAIGEEGTGDDEQIADAVDWCVEQQADIVSLSLGGDQGFGSGFFSTDALEQSVEDAIDEGVYVVAAAGNDGEDDDGDVESPGSVEDVICVGGITRYGNIWVGSSEGDNNGRIWPNPILPRDNPDKKPELVAPAHEVPVLMAGGRTVATSRVFSGCGPASRTSRATHTSTSARPTVRGPALPRHLLSPASARSHTERSFQ